MTTARRRIVRPNSLPQSQLHHQLQKLRARLERERAALLRWQRRPRRAFTAVERLHPKIARLERQIALLSIPQ
jgi:hypothetical protein